MLYCSQPVGKGGCSVGEEKGRKSKKTAFDDYEYEYGYGYDYLLDEETKKPTDTAEDADGPEEDEGAWWEDEPEEKMLARTSRNCWNDTAAMIWRAFSALPTPCL